jgi:hypothetical protein
MTRMDVFVIVTGSFTVLVTVPMILLAMWSRREAEELRHIQTDLVTLMEESRRLAEEMHLLQAEFRKEQHEAVGIDAQLGDERLRDRIPGVDVHHAQQSGSIHIGGVGAAQS